MYAENFSTTTDAACVAQEYYEGYADLGVHSVMLRDGPRMRFFWEAMACERGMHSAIRDAVVVDVGAGTGVLSMWAARCGAKKVIAIEASSVGASLLRALIADNGFGSTISVINAAVEDIAAGGTAAFIESQLAQLGEGTGVSVLVSEWIGFYLLHECMLPSVIAARDFFGDVNTQLGFAVPHALHERRQVPLMLPSAATIWASPVNLQSLYEVQHQRFWRDGIAVDPSRSCTAAVNAAASRLNFERVGRAIFDATLAGANPLIEQLPPGCVAALGAVPKPIKTLDLNVCSVSDALEVGAEFSLQFTEDTHAPHQGADSIDGLCIWFDIEAALPSNSAERPSVCLSTSPSDAPTHWKQSTVVFPRGPDGSPQLLRSDFLRMSQEARPKCRVEIRCSDPTTRIYELDVEFE